MREDGNAAEQADFRRKYAAVGGEADGGQIPEEGICAPPPADELPPRQEQLKRIGRQGFIGRICMIIHRGAFMGVYERQI